LPRGKTATQNAKQAAAALAGLLGGKGKGKQKPKIGEAQNLLDRIRYKPYVNTKIGVFDQGQAHNKARFGRRKSVPKNQFVGQVVTKDSQLTKYFKEKRGNVGIAKSGWAVCAGLLGGFKKIPKWVYRHTGGGRVNDQSGKGLGIVSKPFIQMTNTIPWINAVISTATIQKSIDIQIIKMIKRLRYITAAESKKAGL
jgi:hypothetical protein